MFRNPVLNKSFDVLPQMKDDNATSDDQVRKDNNVLDTTVELPNTNEGLDEKPTRSYFFFGREKSRLFI